MNFQSNFFFWRQGSIAQSHLSCTLANKMRTPLFSKPGWKDIMLFGSGVLDQPHFCLKDPGWKKLSHPSDVCNHDHGCNLRRRKESRLSCMSYESHLFGCSEKSLLEIDSLKESNRPVLAPLEEAARDTPKNTRTLDGMLKPIQSRILQRRRASVWDCKPEVPAKSHAGLCPTRNLFFGSHLTS